MKKVIVLLMAAIMLFSSLTFAAVVPEATIPSRLSSTHPKDRPTTDMFRVMYDRYIKDNDEYKYWTMGYSSTYQYVSIVGSNEKPYIKNSASNQTDLVFDNTLATDKTFREILVYNPSIQTGGTYNLVSYDRISTDNDTHMALNNLEFTICYYYNYDVYNLNGTFYKEGFDVVDEYVTNETNDVLTYKNESMDYQKVEIYSDGTSDITITEPSRYFGNGTATTTKQTFTLSPYEQITVIRNSGDNIHLRVPHGEALSPTEQPLEYVIINQPRNNYESVNRYIIVMGTYKIFAANVSDVQVDFKNIHWDVPMSYDYNADPNVEGSQMVSHKQYDRGDYVEGYFEYEMDFKNTFTGEVEMWIGVTSPLSTQEGYSSFTIKSFVDSNGDGLDDDTEQGLPEDINVEDWEYENVDPSQYSDDIFGRLRYGFDKLFAIIAAPFELIGTLIERILDWITESSSWVGGINKFLTGFMSFIPEEIMGAIMIMFSFTVVFGIIKLFRG